MESSYHLLLRSSLVTFPRILLINGYLVFMHMLANKNYKQRKETGLDLFSLLFFVVRFIGLFLNQLSFRNDLLNKDNFVPQYFFFFFLWGGVSIFFSLNKTFSIFHWNKEKVFRLQNRELFPSLSWFPRQKWEEMGIFFSQNYTKETREGGVSVRDVKHDVMLHNHQIIHTIRHLFGFYMKLYIIKLVIYYGFVSIWNYIF